jgi:hypothetical protein
MQLKEAIVKRHVAALALTIAAAPAAAQLGLPPLGPSVGGVLDSATRQLDPVLQTVDGITGEALRRVHARASRLADLVRRNPDAIELDAERNPARRGELLLVGPDEADVAAATAAGFTVLGRERLDNLDVTVIRIGVPGQTPLRKAEVALRQLLPDATITADTLHFQSGTARRPVAVSRASIPTAAINVPVGIIDGAPGPAVRVAAVRGFTKGALVASAHGSAVASLLQLAGVRQITVADVYGTDPAGGGALAVVRGLDWLVGSGNRVISISLVGPNNLLVAKAVAAAQRRGVHIVAAVGNDGPAAPPSFPASYPGVIAVTAVDGRNRPLIEAGRALHLDYAAPGADLLAVNRDGRWSPVRGTSYAAPFVAARAAAAIGHGDPIAVLDREAIDLGRKGADPVFGRGLLCQSCPVRK